MILISLGVPSDNKRLQTVFLLDEENALLHSFNTSMDAQSHLVLDVYAKVTRSPQIKADNSLKVLHICSPLGCTPVALCCDWLSRLL